MIDMKISRIIIVVGLVLTAAVAAAQSQPPLPKAEAPVLITSCGQSPDAKIVSILAKRIGLEHTYDMAAKAEQLGKYKTLIVVIGGSGKGLGAAGIDVPDEQERVDKILARAREMNIFILGMHIGGEERRGPVSANFVPYAAEVDYLIVKEDGNQDGYFTKLAADNKIPLYTIQKSMEVADLLKQIFGVK
jgi:hypothetical protein